jgi:hypothetical protein
MNLLTFSLVTLAVYRISYMIALEEGPFGMIASIRERIDPNQTSWLGRGVRCVACVSFWLSLIAALMIQATALEWLGIAGGVLLIHRAVK